MNANASDRDRVGGVFEGRELTPAASSSAVIKIPAAAQLEEDCEI